MALLFGRKPWPHHSAWTSPPPRVPVLELPVNTFYLVWRRILFDTPQRLWVGSLGSLCRFPSSQLPGILFYPWNQKMCKYTHSLPAILSGQTRLPSPNGLRIGNCRLWDNKKETWSLNSNFPVIFTNKFKNFAKGKIYSLKNEFNLKLHSKLSIKVNK